MTTGDSMKRHFRAIIVVFLVWTLLQPGSILAKSSNPLFHYRDKAVVLMYHHFAETENGATISAKKFRSQLKTLRDNGYHFISMNDFLLFKLHGNDLPDNAVLITIDDGYESVYRVAYPVLREFGAEAATFVVVQSTDYPMKNGENFPHLSWSQMREMKSAGMSFYSHTYGLHRKVAADVSGRQAPALTSRLYSTVTGLAESDEEYRHRILADLQLADQRLNAELGNKTNLLCFPYGSYNQEVVDLGRAADIQLFFTTEQGINENNGSYLIKRMNAGTSAMTDQALTKKLRTFDQSKK
jgi:biofilm PGA synthesis lipoprotein PgaB